MNRLPRSKGDGWAFFKDAHELKANDVWRMRVEVGKNAADMERYGETYKIMARVELGYGTTDIYYGIRPERQFHSS